MSFLAEDPGLAEREVRQEPVDGLLVSWVVFAFVVRVSLVVVLVAPEQDDAAGLLVAEERDGRIDLLLEWPEAHDVAEGLDGVEDAVRA